MQALEIANTHCDYLTTSAVSCECNRQLLYFNSTKLSEYAYCSCVISVSACRLRCSAPVSNHYSQHESSMRTRWNSINDRMSNDNRRTWWVGRNESNSTPLHLAPGLLYHAGPHGSPAAWREGGIFVTRCQDAIAVCVLHWPAWLTRAQPAAHVELRRRTTVLCKHRAVCLSCVFLSVSRCIQNRSRHRSRA